MPMLSLPAPPENPSQPTPPSGSSNRHDAPLASLMLAKYAPRRSEQLPFSYLIMLEAAQLPMSMVSPKEIPTMGTLNHSLRGGKIF